ncbi:MAG: glycosyltransferase family 2 protein [Candidatus Woesearchaeota archaeon]
MKYSLVLPCKDEEQTIGICIQKAKNAFKKLRITDYEIIVIDNNSIDYSATLAAQLNVRVIREPLQGYGAALQKGFTSANGSYIIMCDADDTYNLEELPLLIKHTEYDIVIGNRFNHKMQRGAMSFMHRYIGNPLFSKLSKLFFKIPCTDIHSGFRIIKKDALTRLNLQSSGMEIASEMLIKAQQLNMYIKEVNITYHKRVGKSKMRSFNDGWRHLKMMLLYAPIYLFLIPGSVCVLVGFLLMISLLFMTLTISNISTDIHFMIVGSILAILGYQLVMLWLYTQTYRIIQLHEHDRIVEYIHNKITLEKTAGIGLGMIGISIIGGVVMLASRMLSDVGLVNSIKFSILIFTIMVIGVLTIASGFMLSILGNKR